MAQDPAALRKERDKLGERGMWRDALNFYQVKLRPVADPASGRDLERAVMAVGRLNVWGEFDGLVEGAVDAQPENAQLLLAAAKAYREVPHSGRLIAGEFQRDGAGRFGIPRFAGMRPAGRPGGRPGGPAADPEATAGARVDTGYRDHIRALQLLRQAIAKAKDDPERAGVWGDSRWFSTTRNHGNCKL